MSAHSSLDGSDASSSELGGDSKSHFPLHQLTARNKADANPASLTDNIDAAPSTSSRNSRPLLSQPSAGFRNQEGSDSDDDRISQAEESADSSTTNSHWEVDQTMADIAEGGKTEVLQEHLRTPEAPSVSPLTSERGSTTPPTSTATIDEPAPTFERESADVRSLSRAVADDEEPDMAHKPVDQAADLDSKKPKTPEPEPVSEEAWLLVKALKVTVTGTKLASRPDVVIVLDPKELTKVYFASSSAIGGNSTVLDNLLEGDISGPESYTAPALNEGKRMSIRYLLVLESANVEGGVPLLARKQLNYVRSEEVPARPVVRTSPPRLRSRVNKQKLKQESPQDDKDVQDFAAEKETDFLVAYDVFLRIIHSQAIKIRPDDWDEALPQIEGVIKLMEPYKAYTACQRDLGNVILNGAQRTWRAVSTDAARWLLIAASLENETLFSEAMAHVVGCWPAWP